MARSLRRHLIFFLPTWAGLFLSRPKSNRHGQCGQIAIEYVLILVVAVTIAVTLSKGLVSRDPQDPGLIIKSWANILRTVGKDLADSPAR